MNNKYIFLVKLLLTLLTCYFLYLKINLQEVLGYTKHVNLTYLSIAFLALLISQIFSSFRMRHYFVSSNIKCSPKFAIALYGASMFYNNLLPGGITGDGYKIILLNKLEKISKIILLKLIFSDRANGLLALSLLTILLAFKSQLTQQLPFSHFFLTAVLFVTISGYYFVTRFALSEKLSTSLKALKYSFTVQILCLISASSIFIAMDADLSYNQSLIEYLMLFMFSAIIAIVPISVGGAGLRELTFLYGSQYLHLDPSIGIAFAVIYFFINLLVSLTGIIFTGNIEKYYR